jgi:bifunctional non-homologous end joining protein LigD
MSIADSGAVLQAPHSSIDPLSPEQRAALVDHYRRVIPWLMPHAENTPLVVSLYPRGLDQQPTFLASLHKDPPAAMHAIEVPSQHGALRYLAFEERSALWEVHRGAFELHSWTPLASDPERARFARIILAPTSDHGLALVKTAAVHIRTALAAHKLEAVVGIDSNGAVLWIPFVDGPHYEPLRTWLHDVSDATIAAHPDVFTNGHEPNRIRIDVGSNATGRWSAWPYSIRGNSGLTMLTPVSWTDLAAAKAATLQTTLTEDVFGNEIARIKHQRFDALQPISIALLAANAADGHSHVVSALKQLLADGKAHAAEDLCAAGIAAKLLPPGTKSKYVVNAVRGLIGRQQLRGERADFVELADGRFRLNIPVDPFSSDHQPMVIDPEVEALCRRLSDAANRKIAPGPNDVGNTGAPFERAVADAFIQLGFIAVRDGRHAAPDVVATAPLGASAFTLVAECKSFDSATPHIQWVAASEAARFRDQVGAQYAVLIGAGFPGDKPLDDELQTHGVALWDVDDLIAVLRADASHPIAWPELVPLLAAGRASERVSDLIFQHQHGARQRASIVLRFMLEEGLTYQRSLCEADTQVQHVNAPLSVDSLTLLVNQRLEREGDLARASLDDIRSAIAVAASPLIGAVDQTGETVTIISRAPLPLRALDEVGLFAR